MLRVLVPFVAGILMHRLAHNWWLPAAAMVVSVVLYAGLAMRSRTAQERLRWRPYFIIPLAMAALSLGWLCAIIHCPPRLAPEQRSGHMLAGRVTEVEFTDYSTRLTVDVLDNTLPPGLKVLVSTRGCDYTLRAGDVVAWPCRLEEITAMGNPDEMDYAAYLLHQHGVRYQQHLPIEQVRRVGQSPTLATRLANIRRDLSLLVFNSRLSPGAQRFVVALLLGNSRFIDKTERQEFSAAGVAHVLALSGLHVGLIALMLWWLLFPLDYVGGKKLRLTLTLVAIALFAVFTGLSPSVLRATVMTGFAFLSMVLYRRSVAFNALAAAALLILLFSPSALYSVGFQLSFVTVAAVLLFARLPRSLESRHALINLFTSTALTSVVALLATVALTAHYFHTVSLLAVVANLLVLPVLPLFMVLGAVFLMVIAGGLQWPLLERGLDALYRYIHWSAGAVNAIPLSHVSGVYVSTTGVVLYFAVMGLLGLWIYRRNYRYLLAAGAALAILLTHSLWIDAHTPRRGLVVFNAYTSTPILFHESGKAWLWIPDDDGGSDLDELSRYYAGYLSRHGIEDIEMVADSTVAADGAVFAPPLARVMEKRLLAVGSGRWKSLTSRQRLRIDDIIVTKRFHGTAAKLQELYDFKRMIISGAMHESVLKPLLHECDSLHIAVHALSLDGAVIENE